MTKRTHSRMRSARRTGLAFAALVTIATAGGCADDGLDGLTAPGIEEMRANADLVTADPWIGPAIEDALTRVVPSLGNPADAAPLQVTLAALQNHLEAGNMNAAAGAIAAVEGVIEAYEQHAGPDSPDAPELDAIRLAIGAI